MYFTSRVGVINLTEIRFSLSEVLRNSEIEFNTHAFVNSNEVQREFQVHFEISSGVRNTRAIKLFDLRESRNEMSNLFASNN